MISIGRGFYEFEFSSDDDMRITLAMGTVNLKSGLLRLSRWSKDFNNYFQRLTHAHVWIRLLDLPSEYWLDRTLMEIAVAIGTPLIMDVATQKRTFGHYVRVLVDIDFSHRLFYEIMVEREGCEFPVEAIENVIDEMANTNDHWALENGDKSASYYHLALENVTDEIARTNALTQTTRLEPVLQLQNVIASIKTLHHEEGIAQVEREGLEVSATSHSPAIQSHPFVNVIPHRCPIITRDLEVIKQALVVSNVADKEGYTIVISKSNRKKNKSYQTRSRGPLPNPSL